MIRSFECLFDLYVMLISWLSVVFSGKANQSHFEDAWCIMAEHLDDPGFLIRVAKISHVAIGLVSHFTDDTLV